MKGVMLVATMEKVRSSNIDSIGYEKGSLFVRFKRKGVLYKYEGVPPELYQSLLEANSKGAFFHRNIKRVFPAFRINGVSSAQLP